MSMNPRSQWPLLKKMDSIQNDIELMFNYMIACTEGNSETASNCWKKYQERRAKKLANKKHREKRAHF